MDKIQELTTVLEKYYAKLPVSKDLSDAILYSLLGGGKRIRPIILLDLLEALSYPITEEYLKIAAAIEMIHTGSLIHDDLPAMDNDDYRRGRLTNHKKFDEATAILAGDSLFLDPFGLIAEAEIPDRIKVSLIKELSYASGTYGMVGGQMLDMKAEGKKLSIESLQAIHKNKTGQLLCYPFLAAAIISDLSNDYTAVFVEMGQLVGLAFQIRDDILDITADFANLGKTPKKDILAEKLTYPSLIGLDKSYDLLNRSLDKALDICSNLEESITFESSKVRQLIEGLRLNA